MLEALSIFLNESKEGEMRCEDTNANEVYRVQGLPLVSYFYLFTKYIMIGCVLVATSSRYFVCVCCHERTKPNLSSWLLVLGLSFNLSIQLDILGFRVVKVSTPHRFNDANRIPYNFGRKKKSFPSFFKP